MTTKPISLDNIVNYIESKEWKHKPLKNENIHLYTKTIGDVDIQLVLPHEDATDFNLRIQCALRTMEIVERRHKLDIIQDILEQNNSINIDQETIQFLDKNGYTVVPKGLIQQVKEMM
jgi:hypothetical protein